MTRNETVRSINMYPLSEFRLNSIIRTDEIGESVSQHFAHKFDFEIRTHAWHICIYSVRNSAPNLHSITSAKGYLKIKFKSSIESDLAINMLYICFVVVNCWVNCWINC